MTGYRFHAHVGVRVQPPAASVSEFVRGRHAVPVTIPRVRGEECPLAATCAGASQGPRAAPVLIRRMPDGFYVEVLGPRNERLGEDEFSELAATSGTMGSRGVVAWPSNPFGDPPAHGPDRYPALGRGSDGYEAAVGKARSRAAALVSVDGIVQAWINSPHHLENMLGRYSGVGVAVAHNPSSNNWPYWAMVLSN